jgi:hypothetical protein
MRTDENRARYDRSKLHYPRRADPRGMVVGEAGDLTHQMWWQQADGGVREVMNGVMYVLSTGCQCVLS